MDLQMEKDDIYIQTVHIIKVILLIIVLKVRGFLLMNKKDILMKVNG